MGDTQFKLRGHLLMGMRNSHPSMLNKQTGVWRTVTQNKMKSRLGLLVSTIRTIVRLGEAADPLQSNRYVWSGDVVH